MVSSVSTPKPYSGKIYPVSSEYPIHSPHPLICLHPGKLICKTSALPFGFPLGLVSKRHRQEIRVEQRARLRCSCPLPPWLDATFLPIAASPHSGSYQAGPPHVLSILFIPFALSALGRRKGHWGAVGWGEVIVYQDAVSSASTSFVGFLISASPL